MSDLIYMLRHQHINGEEQFEVADALEAKDQRIAELTKALVYLRSRFLMHTEYVTAILRDDGKTLHPASEDTRKEASSE